MCNKNFSLLTLDFVKSIRFGPRTILSLRISENLESTEPQRNYINNKQNTR